VSQQHSEHEPDRLPGKRHRYESAGVLLHRSELHEPAGGGDKHDHDHVGAL